MNEHMRPPAGVLMGVSVSAFFPDLAANEAIHVPMPHGE